MARQAYLPGMCCPSDIGGAGCRARGGCRIGAELQCLDRRPGAQPGCRGELTQRSDGAVAVQCLGGRLLPRCPRRHVADAGRALERLVLDREPSSGPGHQLQHPRGGERLLYRPRLGSRYQVSLTYIAEWNGSFWARVPSPSPSSTFNNLGGVAAVSDASAWAVGRFSSGNASKVLVLHWNGTNWTRQAAPTPGGSDAEFRGVTALSARNAWAVGDFSTASGGRTLIEHWNGSKWARVPSPNPRNVTGDLSLDGVAGTSASNVWAVGSYTSGHRLKTLIEHWNGRSWKLGASPSPGSSNLLISVTATSARNAWAVGNYTHGKHTTLILHWNGRAWSRVASPSPGAVSALGGVAATGRSGVWAVGDSISGGITRVLVAHCC
jgi:hypothetical protein